MKKLNTTFNSLINSTAFVALSSSAFAENENSNVAILGAELKTNEQGLVQLLPYGKFKAVDGRPQDTANKHWLMDEAAFEALKANAPHKVGDIVIDYEHQTLKADKNGKPAIAAGFFNINDVQLIQGKGLFIKPRWTENAQAHLNGGEYKYISAVFAYDKVTGRPQFLHSAGLVNRPGVDGMQPLAELAAKELLTSTHTPQLKNKEEHAVNPILLAILQALGIKAPKDLPSEPAALQAFEDEVLTALSAIQAKADEADSLTSQIAVLSAGGNPDPTNFVPLAALTELQDTVAALQAKITNNEVEGLVSLGMEQGKILASMKDWATDLGNKDVAALKGFLDKAPELAALKGKQTQQFNLDNSNDDNVTALSAEDKEAASLLGINEDEFAKQKAADVKTNNGSK